jgi:hypothetical protein
MPGAPFESWSMARHACIATTRTFGQFLKHRNPQSEVKVKDLQSGEVLLVAYKADAG